MIFLICIVVAAALLFWPDSGIKIAGPKPVEAPKSPSYRSAIESLASVRTRLIATQNLDEKATAAINDLTLCLVAGSDKE